MRRWMVAVLTARLAHTGTRHGIAVWWPDGATRQLTLDIPGSDRAAPPPVCDAAAVAALPLAMRAGLPLHVAGPVSAGAMASLREMVVGWSGGGRYGLAPVSLSADTVVAGLSRPSGHAALVAWQNDLDSAFTVLRHATGSVQGAFAVRAALRLHGMGDGAAEAAAAGPSAAAAATLGVPFLVVGSNAAEAGFIDPVIGPTPLLAAALQLAAPLFPDAGTGLIARAYRYDSLLRLTRPGPALPDVMGSDLLAIRTDGGGLSPAVAAACVGAAPDIVAALRAAPPAARRRAGLAFAAAGLPPLGPFAGPRRLATILALPLWRDGAAAEARAIDAGWAGPRGVVGRALRWRLAVDHAAMLVMDHARWFAAMAGLRRPWPR